MLVPCDALGAGGVQERWAPGETLCPYRDVGPKGLDPSTQFFQKERMPGVYTNEINNTKKVPKSKAY